MTQEEVKRQLKPNLTRLKQLGDNLQVGQIFGSRVLVKTVVPMTGLEKYKSSGVVIPEALEKENTPLPSTGVVVGVGALVCKHCGELERSPLHQPPPDSMKWLDSACGFEPVIKPGDMVMFPKYSGSDFIIQEMDFRILEARDILCTLLDAPEALEVVEVTSVPE